ncbi:MAG: hypothetical protein GY838_10070 [bacterium]|nr:hypothetical protein [bacterium]
MKRRPKQPAAKLMGMPMIVPWTMEPKRSSHTALLGIYVPHPQEGKL